MDTRIRVIIECDLPMTEAVSVWSQGGSSSALRKLLSTVITNKQQFIKDQYPIALERNTKTIDQM